MYLSLFAEKKRLCLAGNWAYPQRIALPQDSKVKDKRQSCVRKAVFRFNRSWAPKGVS